MVLSDERKKEICGLIGKAAGGLLGKALANDLAAQEAIFMQIRFTLGFEVSKAERELVMEVLGISIGRWRVLEKTFRSEHPEYDPNSAVFNPQGRKGRAARPLNALSTAMENNTARWPKPVAKAFSDKARADYEFLVALTMSSNKGRPAGEKAKTKKDIRNYATGNRLLMDRTPNSKARNPSPFIGKK